MPSASAKLKAKPKATIVKARSRITEDANANGGLPKRLLAPAERIAQKRRPKRPLNDLYTKLAEKSTVDISQVGGPRNCKDSPRAIPFIPFESPY